MDVLLENGEIGAQRFRQEERSIDGIVGSYFDSCHFNFTTETQRARRKSRNCKLQNRNCKSMNSCPHFSICNSVLSVSPWLSCLVCRFVHRRVHGGLQHLPREQATLLAVRGEAGA